MLPRVTQVSRHPAANERYVESGEHGFALLLPFAALPLTASAAFLYVGVAMSMPLVGYFTALLVVLFAFAVAVPLGHVGRLLKVRSVSAMRAYGIATGLMAVYFAWVFFAWQFHSTYLPAPSPSLSDWLGSPQAVWGLANAIAPDGWFEVRGLRPAGSLLWTLWGVEAVIVVVACAVFAPRGITDRPYCETCDRWMSLELQLAIGSLSATQLRRIGLASIETMVVPRPGGPCFRLRAWRCARCTSAATLRVDRLLKTDLHDLWSPWAELRSARYAEPVVPLSWQRPDDLQHLQRLAAAVRTAPAG